jgi:drug/metabolite transporter (DMT)-like permease
LAFGNMLGNILAILSGICFGSLPIFLHRQKSSSPMETIFLGNIITALISIPFMFQSAPTPLSWLGLVLLGTFQLGLSYVLYALAVKHVTALESLLIPVVEPFLNPIWVFLIMGERPGTWAVVGGVIVLSAVTIRCVIVASRP